MERRDERLPAGGFPSASKGLEDLGPGEGSGGPDLGHLGDHQPYSDEAEENADGRCDQPGERQEGEPQHACFPRFSGRPTLGGDSQVLTVSNRRTRGRDDSHFGYWAAPLRPL
jgi:hypothetical protein